MQVAIDLEAERRRQEATHRQLAQRFERGYFRCYDSLDCNICCYMAGILLLVGGMAALFGGLALYVATRSKLGLAAIMPGALGMIASAAVIVPAGLLYTS